MMHIISLVLPKDAPISLVFWKMHISLVLLNDAHISLVLSNDVPISLMLQKDNAH